MVAPLGVDRYARLVVLTGAGVSVASGLPAYRGPGGLWENEEIAALVHADAIPARLPELWRLYVERRRAALGVGPNPAHAALAALQRRLPGRVTLLTQNVDHLHQRAGSPEVVELHGSGFRSRCTRCALPPFFDETLYRSVPLCPDCGAPLRPDVVLFGEALSPATLHRARASLRACDLFLAAGTSGLVWPAAAFVEIAHRAGARCIAVNIASSGNPSFQTEVLGPAEAVLPALLAEVRAAPG